MLYIPYPFKRCTKCDTEYPTTTEYFHADARLKNGLQSVCKYCDNARALRYYRAHVEQSKARCATYREEHSEQLKAHDHKYYREHSEKVKECSAQWAHKHPEARKVIEAKYRRNHPETVSAKSHRRRARKLSAEGTYNGDDIKAQLKRQKKRCYYCGKKLNSKYHADHVIPLSRGGSNGPDNLVIACPQCNWRKNDRLPHEWPEGGRLL